MDERSRKEIIRTRAKIVTTGMVNRGCVYLGVHTAVFQPYLLFKIRQRIEAGIDRSPLWCKREYL